MNGVEDIPPDRVGRTPYRIFREHAARERLEHVARLRDALSRPPLAAISGYSFKTNPRAELVRMARECVFFAETISGAEVAHAEREGFPPDEIIYNGPEPPPERGPNERLAIVFADSVEALASNVRRNVARTYGVRFRPSMLESRFGVPVDDEPLLGAALRALPAGAGIGVSFHARREDFKGATWRDVAGDVLARAAALQRETGRPIIAFDVGGGWTPEQFDAEFEPDMRWIIERITRELPSCERLVFEPGQAVCTPAEALVTKVLEVRVRGARREAIVDLAYSDWPQMHSYVHGFFVLRGGAWQPLGHGPDRLGGRTCLEYDLIDGLRFPEDLGAGDRLLITETGSYDHSMAFDFAEGKAAGQLVER